GNRSVSRQRWARLVVTLRPLAAVDVIGRRHAARVDRLHLLGVMQDIGELPGEELFLFVAELELRERGDALHVGNGEGRWQGEDRNAKCKMQNADTTFWRHRGESRCGVHPGAATTPCLH